MYFFLFISIHLYFKVQTRFRNSREILGLDTIAADMLDHSAKAAKALKGGVKIFIR